VEASGQLHAPSNAVNERFSSVLHLLITATLTARTKHQNVFPCQYIHWQGHWVYPNKWRTFCIPKLMSTTSRCRVPAKMEPSKICETDRNTSRWIGRGGLTGWPPPSSSEVKRMSGAILPLPQYAFMAWCSVQKSTGTT
jgi:hypothetical protein